MGSNHFAPSTSMTKQLASILPVITAVIVIATAISGQNDAPVALPVPSCYERAQAGLPRVVECDVAVYGVMDMW